MTAISLGQTITKSKSKNRQYHIIQYFHSNVHLKNDPKFLKNDPKFTPTPSEIHWEKRSLENRRED